MCWKFFCKKEPTLIAVMYDLSLKFVSIQRTEKERWKKWFHVNFYFFLLQRDVRLFHWKYHDLFSRFWKYFLLLLYNWWICFIKSMFILFTIAIYRKYVGYLSWLIFDWLDLQNNILWCQNVIAVKIKMLFFVLNFFFRLLCI